MVRSEGKLVYRARMVVAIGVAMAARGAREFRGLIVRKMREVFIGICPATEACGAVNPLFQMKHANLRFRGLLLVALLSAAAFGQGQGQQSGKAPKFYRAETVPDRYRQVVDALGDRVKSAGKERVLLTGTLQLGAQPAAPATVTLELPGRLRIEHAAGRARVLVFDLTESKGRAVIDDEDEELIESLGLDNAEQFLDQLDERASVRLLGHGFRLLNETGFGSSVDIYEVAVPMPSRRDKQVRIKHFMFDTQTGLMRRVAYTISKGGVSVRVETVLSDYAPIEGNNLPGRIVRRENGREVMRFQRTAAAISPRANDNAFRQP